MGDTMRSFVAIPLSKAAVHALRRVQGKLGQGPGGQACRWVRPENIHLTLKFLGDIPVSDAPRISVAVQEACAVHAPFDIILSRLGCFPNPQHPRVLWVGIEGDAKALSQLQRSVEHALSALGYPSESRPFSPHLTIARIKNGARRADIAALGQTVGTSSLGEIGRVTVENALLMRSDIRPSGPIYTALARADLRGDE